MSEAQKIFFEDQHSLSTATPDLFQKEGFCATLKGVLGVGPKHSPGTTVPTFPGILPTKMTETQDCR